MWKDALQTEWQIEEFGLSQTGSNSSTSHVERETFTVFTASLTSGSLPDGEPMNHHLLSLVGARNTPPGQNTQGFNYQRLTLSSASRLAVSGNEVPSVPSFRQSQLGFKPSRDSLLSWEALFLVSLFCDLIISEQESTPQNFTSMS